MKTMISYKKAILSILLVLSVVISSFPTQINVGAEGINQDQQNDSLGTQQYKQPNDKDNNGTDRYIVKYKDGASEIDFQEVLTGKFDKVKKFKSKKQKRYGLIMLKNKMKQEDVLEALKQNNVDTNIEYIQPDYEMKLSSEDPNFNEQWSIYNWQTVQGSVYENIHADVNVVPAWDISQGDGVMVAVLDTGIDINHEDLKDNIWTNTKEMLSNGIDDVNGWNFADDTNKVFDSANVSEEEHGTHIAGIISAEKDNNIGIAGVAPKAKVMSLKVFSNGTAYTSDIIEAINYAESMGVKIANCSWGSSSGNPALKETIENSSMLFVCAAGNSRVNIDVGPIYPASWTSQNIISVASMNKDVELSSFSNYGVNSVNVAAPGEEIISTLPGNTYGQKSGTSMAAGFVSGQAALIQSKNSGVNANEIKQMIMDNSDSLSSMIGKVYKGSRINCYNSLLGLNTNDIVDTNNNESISVVDSVYQNIDGYSLFTTGEWVSRANMPTARDSLAVAELNGKIYTIGGYNGSYQNKVEEYDSITNTWIAKANMPTARQYLGAVSVNGKIYAIGGFNGTSRLNTVEEYNPVTNTWASKANMPTARERLAVTALNGKIYAIGGYNGAKLGTVEEYDPSTNTWSTKASMATIREGLGATALNGKIYAIGGYNTTYLNTVEEYDPSLNTWTVKANMTTARKFLGVSAANEKIYAIGGMAGNPVNTVEEYSPTSNTWATQPNMITARYSPGTATVGTKIFAIGGYSGTYSNKTETFLLAFGENAPSVPPANIVATGSTSSIIVLWDTVLDATGYDIEVDGTVISNGTSTSYVHSGLTANTQHTYRVRAKNIAGTSAWSSVLTKNTADQSNQIPGQWVTKANMSGARYNLSASELNGKIYAVGGYYTSRLNRLEEYDTNINVWTTKANMPTARDMLGTATANGKVYAIGGYATTYTNVVQEYNPTTNIWSSKTNMPTARGNLGVVELNGKIYAIGGYNGSYLSTVEEYDIATNTWTTKASMPTARRYPSVTAVNGKIYAIDGYNGSYLNIIEEYDPATNTWSKKGALPTARYSAGVAVVLNRIYIIGGYSASGVLNKVEEYDPETNMCTTHLNMATARYLFGTAVSNGKVYAIGGNPNTYTVEALEFVIPPVPTVPLNLVATAADTTITITWDPVANASSYEIELDETVINNGTNTSYTHTNLTPGTQHNYKVRAKNLSGTSSWSSVVTKSTLLIGLKGEYYDNIDFTNIKLTITDNVINFDWGVNAPNALMDADTFAVRWTGQIEPMYSETYKLYTYTNGGVRLWINGQLIIGNWVDQGTTENSGTISLVAGQKYDIKIEYFENTNDAIAKISWSSLSQPKEIIPSEQLSPTYSGVYEGDKWSEKSSFFENRSNHGVVSLNNKIYVIGGSDGGYLSRVEEYDPITDTWATKANIPTARDGLGVTTVNGKIYAIGGYNGTYLNTVEEYDPIINTWTSKANMPTARQRLAVTAMNGKIYAIGGYNGAYLNTVEEYDPISDTWMTKANMPTGRDGLGVMVANEKIYAIGGAGMTGIGITNIVEEYDPITNTWSTKASMPTARRYVGVAMANNRIYAIDGRTNETVLNKVEEYNPVTDTWITRGDMPAALWLHGTASVGDKIYTIGGYDINFEFVNTVKEYIPPVILPDAPSESTGINSVTTNTSITVTWDSVADVTGYEIEVDGEVIDNSTQTTYIHNGLVPGSQHTYRVRTKNIGGSGAWSTALTKLALIAPPTNVVTSSKSNQITITWDAIEEATGYEIEADGEVIDCGANTSYTHSGLISNTTHTYRVRAKDAIFQGEWSVMLTKQTLVVLNCSYYYDNNGRLEKILIDGYPVIQYEYDMNGNLKRKYQL